MGTAKLGTLWRVARTRMPTRWGMFEAIGYERDVANGRHRVETAVALLMGDLKDDVTDGLLLRIHSQCFTGEMLGSLRCDCGDQLAMAMQAIAEEGRGLIIYEYQEGRGIGLMAKLQAYKLQDVGIDTVEANHALGFKADCRDFSLPAAILHELGIKRVRLLSNNPQKARALTDAGIEVGAQLACEATPTPYSAAYLRTKKNKMGHALTLVQDGHTQFDGVESPTVARTKGPQHQIETGNVLQDDQFDFAGIEAAIGALKAGHMIVVVDDEDRENEGDLIMAAEMITPGAINFMSAHGRGLICLAMTEERLDQLELAPMVPSNSALGGTAFMVSIDARGDGVTTGISAHDRARTIRTAIDPNCYPEDLARPGHVFPLRARLDGVLERRGHTEAAVDLARLAGLYPAGVICEIINDDGTMARVPDLVSFCKRNNLLMITVAELARYRLESEYDESLAAIHELFPLRLRDSATALGQPSTAVEALSRLNSTDAMDRPDDHITRSMSA
jgi:3,4-dihydroxy-2-butanone 4-phosphate synthase/GTP cyclohydrolase II